MKAETVLNIAAQTADGFVKAGKHPFTSAVILAGGIGSRMGKEVGGNRTKQFMELCGMPVILHTLRAFENCPLIDEIVLVVRKEEKERYPVLLQEARIHKVRKLVAGGETRQDSAENGLHAVSDDCRFIAIHDGARPLITPAQIAAVAEEAYRIGAATAACHAKDTVKLTDSKGYIAQTPDRACVWNASTPQIFRVEEYRAAVYLCKERGLTVTDDCSLVEAVGFPVKPVDVGYRNLKITTPEDLCFAEALLSCREQTAQTQKETDRA